MLPSLVRYEAFLLQTEYECYLGDYTRANQSGRVAKASPQPKKLPGPPKTGGPAPAAKRPCIPKIPQTAPAAPGKGNSTLPNKQVPQELLRMYAGSQNLNIRGNPDANTREEAEAAAPPKTAPSVETFNTVDESKSQQSPNSVNSTPPKEPAAENAPPVNVTTAIPFTPVPVDKNPVSKGNEQEREGRVIPPPPPPSELPEPAPAPKEYAAAPAIVPKSPQKQQPVENSSIASPCLSPEVQVPEESTKKPDKTGVTLISIVLTLYRRLTKQSERGESCC
jgi:hypothetical protein